MKDQATEAAIATVANKVTATGTGITLFGYLTLNDFALIVGVLVTIAGFAVNLHYKRKHDRRAEELHQARLSELKDDGDRE